MAFGPEDEGVELLDYYEGEGEDEDDSVFEDEDEDEDAEIYGNFELLEMAVDHALMIPSLLTTRRPRCQAARLCRAWWCCLTLLAMVLVVARQPWFASALRQLYGRVYHEEEPVEETWDRLWNETTKLRRMNEMLASNPEWVDLLTPSARRDMKAYADSLNTMHIGMPASNALILMNHTAVSTRGLQHYHQRARANNHAPPQPPPFLPTATTAPAHHYIP